MIVVTLLLILVAVTLLVLGLTGGSSTLLISSIVASLLAAVVLVVGARQAAARRRTAAPGPDGVPADPEHDPFLAGAPAPGYARRGAAPPPDDVPSDFSRSDTFSGPDAVPGSEAVPAPATVPDSGAAQGDAPARDDHRRSEPSVPFDHPAVPGFREDAADPGDDPAGPGGDEPGRRQEPDYDRASSVIGAARTAGDDQSWRRDPDAGPPPAAAEAPAAGAPAADEFGEPDEDDPADEPLPQAVRPGDAVRMARIDSEVLVVDGRPRYHVADCAHLVGRLTEALPAREAVELGFSPCGLCRPVDRLIAQATAHH